MAAPDTCTTLEKWQAMNYSGSDKPYRPQGSFTEFLWVFPYGLAVTGAFVGLAYLAGRASKGIYK